MLTIQEQLEYARTTAADNLLLAESLVHQVLRLCNEMGVVVRVDLKSCMPPEMGQYDYQVEVRSSRVVYQHIMKLEAERKKGNNAAFGTNYGITTEQIRELP